MGLAGNKNRRKLAKDPNNTRWTRNTDSFGQKILRSQGWAPGQYLGATGAAHAVHHTEANASHIRVILKDDTLGVGAKRGTSDECTGLGAFQDLLGRLNGKSEETVQKERKAREDFQFSLYIERKYGAMRFVRGGLLVGDRIQKIGDDVEMHTEDETPAAKRSNSVSPVPQVEEEQEKTSTKKPKEQKSKKRKATDEATTETEDEVSHKSKKSKKRADRGTAPKSEDDGSRRKKQRKEASNKVDDSMADATAATDTTEASATDNAGLKMVGRNGKRPKEDKTTEKAAKKATKNEKKSKRRKGENGASAEETKQKKKRKEKSDHREYSTEAPEDISSKESTSTPVAAATPSETGSLTPVLHPGRFHRSRFIAQKRAAVMDTTALNQILMIKVTSKQKPISEA